MEELTVSLSPQLNQVVELLEASRPRLVELIEAELAQNPALRLARPLAASVAEQPDLVVEPADDGQLALEATPLPPLWLVEEPAPTLACRQQADFFRRALEQRRQLLLQVAGAMLRQQGDYLRGHVEAPRSIPLGRLGDEVGLHPSSLGRVLAGKRIATPRGDLDLVALLGRPSD